MRLWATNRFCCFHGNFGPSFRRRGQNEAHSNQLRCRGSTMQTISPSVEAQHAGDMLGWNVERKKPNDAPYFVVFTVKRL